MVKCLLFSILLCCLSLPLWAAEGETCVLVYEREKQPVTKAVTGFFAPVPGVNVKTEAVPLDFLNCVKDGSREIVIIAHGFWRAESGVTDPVFQLGYFTRVQAANGREVYQPKMFYNKIFEEAYKALKKEKEETGTTRLKRIRFAACGIEYLNITHPYFPRIIEEFIENYDEAPVANGIVTWLFARNVPGKKRSISYKWLSKSGRCEEATRWHTSRKQTRACTKDSQSGCKRAKAKFCRATSII